MEHIIHRTEDEKARANQINLKQETINTICRLLWFSQLENKFDKIKDINISIWDKFHSEHRKKINDSIRALCLPRTLSWKIENQCEILIHSLKYFYLVYLRVQNERYVNDIIQDQPINLNNLVWLRSGMVDRQHSLINIIGPILNEFNTSNIFTIGYKFCLPQLLVRVFQVSDCKLGMNLDTNDVHSFLYIYFVCYCKLYTERLVQSCRKNRSGYTVTENCQELEEVNDNRIAGEKHGDTNEEVPRQKHDAHNEEVARQKRDENNEEEAELENIERDPEFKSKLNRLFKAMRFVDIDWLVLMDHGDDNVLNNLMNNYSVDEALSLYSFLTRNKMAFEYFWNRVPCESKPGLCDYLIRFLRYVPTFHNIFYFLIMYDYLPLNFKHFVQNNDSMRKLHQLSVQNERLLLHQNDSEFSSSGTQNLYL
uniref:Uncharacterized protein n=1 Tax=Cacopsylla melanoneura TaxID=428564 RepID=A0A8D8VB49_9HEMI